MKIEIISRTNQALLLSYCEEHHAEHDPSYLPGRDFDLTADHPAYLLMQDGTAVGAVVLMRSERYVYAQKGRFSIFHSVLGTREAYSELLDAVRPHFHGLKSVFLFIPDTKPGTSVILEQLGFNIERFSVVLESEQSVQEEVHFPDGYNIQPLKPSDRTGIQQFSRCINDAFSELAGHTDSNPDFIRSWFDDENYLEGGICLLKMNQEPVGTVAVMRDTETLEGGELFAFGIIKTHRGLGLGRQLLRWGSSFAHNYGLNPVILSVNAENERALRLYESEGFVVTEKLICYALDSS